MENKELSELLALVPLEAKNCGGHSLSCIDRLKNTLSRLFRKMGYDYYVLAEFPVITGNILEPDLFLAVSFDEQWSNVYREKLYDQIDPLFSRCLMPSSDISHPRRTWTECHLSASEHPLWETAEQKADYIKNLNDLFTDAANHGYRSGVVMSHDFAGRRISLSLTSALDYQEHDKRPDAHFWALLKLILLTGNHAIHAIEDCPVCQRGVNIDISLTPSEAQWFQAILDYPKHTLEDIAKRLHRSINTGSSHIRNVKERLGMTVKTPLLAQALKRSNKL